MSETLCCSLAGARWAAGGLTGTVIASLGDRHVYSDAFALSSPDERRRFALDLQVRMNGTSPGNLLDLVEQQLIALVAQAAESSAPRERMAGPAVPAEPPWPEPPNPAAFSGLAGEVVCAIQPHTEADPVALLLNFLTAFGSAVGAGPHCLAGADVHPARINILLVGKTAKGRKGASWSPVKQVFRVADQGWAKLVTSGLSSGEGLISAVRDRVEREVVDRKTGDTRTDVVDEGVADKRLLVLESEFVRVLNVTTRQGNTLSPIIRDAWDTGDLRVLTKSALTASGAHISVVAHITADELRRELSDSAVSNGFANRFLLAAVQRARPLPDPEPFTYAASVTIGERVRFALEQAQHVGLVQRDAAASTLWRDMYPHLSRDRDGLAGALIARAEAQVLRLALIYCLLDGSAVITVNHLLAACAVWEYSERSVAYLFGDRLGDPIADTIIAALRANGELARNALHDLFGRHERSDRIGQALGMLVARGLIRTESRATGGRPLEIYRLA